MDKRQAPIISLPTQGSIPVLDAPVVPDVAKTHTRPSITLTISAAMSLGTLRSLVDESGFLTVRMNIATGLLPDRLKDSEVEEATEVLLSLISYKVTGVTTGLSQVSYQVIEHGHCTSLVEVHACVNFALVQAALDGEQAKDLVADQAADEAPELSA